MHKNCSVEDCCPVGWGCIELTPVFGQCQPDKADSPRFMCEAERPTETGEVDPRWVEQVGMEGLMSLRVVVVAEGVDALLLTVKIVGQSPRLPRYESLRKRRK